MLKRKLLILLMILLVSEIQAHREYEGFEIVLNVDYVDEGFARPYGKGVNCEFGIRGSIIQDQPIER